MYRKTLFLFLIALAFVFANNCSALAQTGQLRGRVLLQQADGTKVPVANAQIDVYREDLPGTFNTKTDKKGNFVFAGLPFVGTYTVSISAPEAQPQARGSIRANDSEYEFVLKPGDGRRLTKDEAKGVIAKGGAPQQTGGKETEEQKKAREEFEKKKAEIEEANKKAESSNAIYKKAIETGNAAINANKFDEAIAAYDEALNADITHPAAPVLLNNKAIALKSRGVERYNTSIKLPDGADKTSGVEAGKNDIKASAEAATKALEMLKAAGPPSDPQQAQNYQASLYNTISTRADALRLVVKIVDTSKAEAAYNAYQEYIAAETDPIKKSKAQLTAAELLLDGGMSDKAYEEFKKLTDADPNNYDAFRGAGLSLFQSGDPAKFQDAANYLQLFVDKAPDTHKDKASAKEALDYLKNEAKIKPQKITPTKKKGN